MLRRSLILITCLFISLLSLTVAAEDWVYRLHQGETLTLVAERFLKPEFTPEQLQVYNGILNDREIPVGTEIRVPIDWMDQALEGVEVRFVFGEAELFRRGQAEAETVARGTMLKAGDRVVTAEKSAVSLAFADGTHLLVGPKSEVVFDALSAFKGRGMLDTRIRLQRGRLENRVKPIKRSGSRYEIHTPAAVTVVRGTDFRVSVESLSELTRSEVTEGEVSVSASGETVAVTAGEGTLIEPGQPPEPPRRLLDPPDLAGLAASYQIPMPTVEWPVLSGAVSYRVQLMDSQASVVFTQQVTETTIMLPEQPTGSYRLLVRGIDELGLEGLSARHDFELQDATPIAPVIERAVPVFHQPLFTGRWLSLHWQPAAHAWTHRLILAHDPKLEELVFDQLTRETGLWLPFPPPGQYYLAVEALFDESEATTRSQVYRLEIPGWH
ncbi:MAG: FecR domain-containing protein [Candidatus Thiodiazotropha sp. (ex Myrtea sp. 'scaly one' KF741663)]|nr:FecR domain-containing protein [Candidatus Thiodiazotropha sp. (ex Myrtea sp. 'scaly one' KF741663)]